jgi:hypothetical protein
MMLFYAYGMTFAHGAAGNYSFSEITLNDIVQKYDPENQTPKRRKEWLLE